MELYIIIHGCYNKGRLYKVCCGGWGNGRIKWEGLTQGGGGSSLDRLVAEVERSLREVLASGVEVELDHVLQGLRRVDRALFIPPPEAASAYEDSALPIGYGATCSQPTVVALMAGLLHVQQGNRVLSVGTGCGYSDAVTYQLLGSSGSLTSIEIVSELAAMVRVNRTHFLAEPFQRIFVWLKVTGSKGYEPAAPYDRIYLAARIPFSYSVHPLLDQLAVGGIMVCPEQIRKKV